MWSLVGQQDETKKYRTIKWQTTGTMHFVFQIIRISVENPEDHLESVDIIPEGEKDSGKEISIRDLAYDKARNGIYVLTESSLYFVHLVN